MSSNDEVFSIDTEKKLLISAYAVIPYVVTTAILLIPMYVARKQSMLGAVWKDSLMIIASVIIFYGLSFGLMYVPWPEIRHPIYVGTTND